MQVFRKAVASDSKSIEKLLGRVELSLQEDHLPPYFPYYTFDSNDFDGVYVCADRRKCVGLLCFSRTLEPIFSGKSRYRKEDDLLSTIPFKGEDIALLRFLCVDPMDRRQKKGTEMFNSLSSLLSKTTFFAPISRFNAPGIEFLKSLGFYMVSEGAGMDIPDRTGIIMAKPYVKQGICSDPRF